MSGLRFSSPEALQAFLQSTKVSREAQTRTKQRKYRNVPTEVDGFCFPSKLQASCYEWLKLRRVAGEVLWFIWEVPFRLPGSPRPVIYRADFLVALAAGGVELWDAKGRDTPVSDLKRKQVRALYGVEVRLWPPR